ncbi:hypothetical protein DM860_014694 [Cuscuta australis]|uniref:rRNA N-glycosylase n=1 Tax=Cuscuta australis TaxID=267555 RepID=A0A328DID3_9ASTE|nr:hypothetical protein DM860_014694 [Cuscuta australis]
MAHEDKNTGTKDLDFSNVIDADTFVDFIKDARILLATPSSLQGIYTVSEKDKGNLHFVNLQYQGSLLQLAMRVNDLYLIGFKCEKGWLELKEKGHTPETKNSIKNGEIIDVYMDYTELRRLSPKTLLGGPEYITRAMNVLRKVNPNQVGTLKEEIAQELLTIITTFIESLRFNHILEYVAGHFSPGRSIASAPEWILKLVRDWGKLSHLVLKYKDSMEKEVITELVTSNVSVYDNQQKREINLMRADEDQQWALLKSRERMIPRELKRYHKSLLDSLRVSAIQQANGVVVKTAVKKKINVKNFQFALSSRCHLLAIIAGIGRQSVNHRGLDESLWLYISTAFS